jgi:predicted RNase H-like HicB family nuclease
MIPKELQEAIGKSAIEKYNPFTGDEDMDGLSLAYMAYKQGGDFGARLALEYIGDLTVSFLLPLEGENYEEDKYIAWFDNPIFKGLCTAGTTKEEAFKELMISMAVKVAYDNNIELLPLLPQPPKTTNDEK